MRNVKDKNLKKTATKLSITYYCGPPLKDTFDVLQEESIRFFVQFILLWFINQSGLSISLGFSSESHANTGVEIVKCLLTARLETIEMYIKSLLVDGARVRSVLLCRQVFIINFIGLCNLVLG